MNLNYTNYIYIELEIHRIKALAVKENCEVKCIVAKFPIS